jgi:hypothetical protein
MRRGVFSIMCGPERAGRVPASIVYRLVREICSDAHGKYDISYHMRIGAQIAINLHLMFDEDAAFTPQEVDAVYMLLFHPSKSIDVREELGLRQDTLKARVAIGAAKIASYPVYISLVRLGFDPSFDESAALRVACGSKWQGLVPLIISDRDVNPAAKNNEAFINLATRGNLRGVQLLLDDKRVDPAARGEMALKTASQNGHAEVVLCLLKDSRIGAKKELLLDALFNALKCGHFHVARLLLLDPRVDPTFNDNHVLEKLCVDGCAEAVRFLLLEDQRVTPTSDAFCCALNKNHLDVMQIFMSDARFNPSKRCIGLACLNDNLDAARMLLADPRVNTEDPFLTRRGMVPELRDLIVAHRARKRIKK